MLFSSDGGNNMKKVRAMYAITGQWGARNDDENPVPRRRIRRRPETASRL